MKTPQHRRITLLFVLSAMSVSAVSEGCSDAASAKPGETDTAETDTSEDPDSDVAKDTDPARGDATSPVIHIPHFKGETAYDRSAIFWLGRVEPSRNAADVRVAYNDDALEVRLASIDRRLWYNATSPTPKDLTAYDSAALYLKTSDKIVMLVAETAPWETDAAYQAAYARDADAWTEVDIAFEVTRGWRGDGFNNDVDDKGWALGFHIPFAALGVATPSAGEIWQAALRIFDRDTADGPESHIDGWPNDDVAVDPPDTAAWGRFAFGLAEYRAPTSTIVETVTLRQGDNGAVVKDVAVGGGTTCGEGLDYWTEWGEATYPNESTFNIQNQSDISDYPCFSKYFVTFLLDTIDASRPLVSASLTLHQFGNSDPTRAQESWIQAASVDGDFDEASACWNNAPRIIETFGGTLVEPLPDFPGWPGVPRNFDVSLAVKRALDAGEPLRLSLYSSDDDYHSGKYFVGSDTEDWNIEARPSLTVNLGYID